MIDAGFPKQSRLLSPKDYSPVFDKPDFRVSSRYLLILARKNSHGLSRAGLVIAKKHIRKAVQRNRIKRILRESFRAKKNQFVTIDFVFLARPKLDTLDNRDMRIHYDKLLSELLELSQK